MRIFLDIAHVTFLHYRIKQSELKKKLIALIEIVTFSSVHDINHIEEAIHPE